MNRLLPILILAFFMGELCTYAQQATATLAPTQTGAGGVPYPTAAFGLAQAGGWAPTAQVGWRLTYANLPANATVAATVTVRYAPRQGNTHVQSFTIPPSTAQPAGTVTATYNGTGVQQFAITFNRNPNGTPAPPTPNLVCGTYTLSVAFTVNGQPGTAPQPQTGNVQYASNLVPPPPPTNQPPQLQRQTAQLQWGLTSWPVGSIIHMGGTNTVRGKVVVLKRVYNRSRGTVEVSKNGILHTRGFLNFQGGNNRQKLRNYRYRSVPKK